MRSLLLVVLVNIWSLALSAQDGYVRDERIDVTQYIHRIQLSEEHDTIVGNSTIIFLANQQVSQLTLDLVHVLTDGNGMFVNKVSQNGNNISFEHKIEKLVITGPFIKGLHQIDVTYSGVPADGLIISKNKYGKRTFFCDNWPNRAHHYIPVVDHPTEKAKSSFEIEAPAKYQVVSNGTQSTSIDLMNGRRVTTWESKQELPPKVTVFGAAEFAVGRCDHADVPVYSWVYPQEQKDGFKDYCMTVDILKWFEQKIAPYPYDQLSNVQSKTRYGGMENAGCIFYHERSIDGKGGSEDLYVHELAHQWFGNSASEADWHHVWLSEGFATYLTEVYKEENYGDSAFKAGMSKAAKRVKSFSKRYPNATIVDTNIENLNQLLNPYTYQRAAWVLHMLRNYVGDESFWKGVTQYYDQFQFGNAWSSDFQTVMEEVSGIDLDLFFKAWLYQPGFPIINAEIQKINGYRFLKVSQSGSNFFPVRVDIYVDLEDKSNIKDEELYRVIMDKPEVMIPIEFSNKFIDLSIDPNNEILD